MNTKVKKVFSGTLMRQNIRSNLILTIVVIIIMCMMSVVVTYAGNLLGGMTATTDYSDVQTDFYTYLNVLAAYDEMTGSDLSYDDFSATDDLTPYETAFSMFNDKVGKDLSTDDFKETADTLSESDVSLDKYITQFEYVYALSSDKGVFSGDDLDAETMINTSMEVMGMDSDLMENMSEIDSSAMLNQMYYTVMLILPILLFIIIAGNALVVDQVDKGSMAYILSTPTKRGAVAFTQMLYMIFLPLIMVAITCCVRMAAMKAFVGSVNVGQVLALYGGLYLLTEAMAALCYFSSCFFNLSKYSMALGGGLNIWFFLASLLGMFGSDNMIQMGIGVDALGVFNHLTLVGLFDIDALATVGSDAVDYSFVWKLCVLFAVAVILYAAGMIKFKKKDLPL